MTMALPTSASQNKLLLKLMKHWNGQVNSPKFNTINAWIRVYIHDTYGGGREVYRVDQDLLTPLAFQYWGSGQPDNTANMENYAVIDIERRYYGGIYYYEGSYGAWNDVAGTSLQHTICEYNIPSVEGSGS